jgi:hypothetical protein
MDEKSPIDKKRESGGYIDIGTEDDGAIIEMINVGNKLIVVKEKSLYELMMADTIDPGRTNIGLPNMIQKLLIKKGTDSEIVGKTFLTAKTLFQSEYFDKKIDTNRLLELSLDLLIELAALEKENNSYLKNEMEAVDEYENIKKNKLPYKLPTIIDLELQCKKIFQNADHVEQILMEIIVTFYPNEGLTKQSHFPLFHQLLIKLYGENDPFVDFIDKTLYFIKIVRAIRNALDHRLKTVRLFNFDLQPDSSILSPSIEVNHKEDKLKRVALSTFLPIVLENFLSIVEDIFAYLAAKNAIPHPMISKIMAIPEEHRRYKFVRYSFWANIGEGGYFSQ